MKFLKFWFFICLLYNFISYGFNNKIEIVRNMGVKKGVFKELDCFVIFFGVFVVSGNILGVWGY